MRCRRSALAVSVRGPIELFALACAALARTPRDIDFTKAEHTAYVLVDATM